MTLDKLLVIRGDLVRTDPDWESWDFVKLTDALRQWVRTNPVDKNAEREGEENKRKRDYYNRLLQARGGNFKIKGCVYCGDENLSCNNTDPLNYLTPVTEVFELKNITMDELRCEMSKPKAGKSTGLDKISNKLLKAVGRPLSAP